MTAVCQQELTAYFFCFFDYANMRDVNVCK